MPTVMKCVQPNRSYSDEMTQKLISHDFRA